MKSACHTDPTNSSQSLVKTIAYPKALKFHSKVTSWGCKPEQQACETYTKMVEIHHELSVTDANQHLTQSGLSSMHLHKAANVLIAIAMMISLSKLETKNKRLMWY